MDIGRLVVCCADKPGIISAVSTFLHNHGANIIDLDQHSSGAPEGKFFLRLEFELKNLGERKQAFVETFSERVAAGYDMQWVLTKATEKLRVAIFVSKFDHALMELLWLASRGILPIEIPMVISNHEDLRKQVEGLGFCFEHVPVTASNKAEAEAATANLLQGKVDLVVLARYMQILSEEFVNRYKNQIINIHHSFLPAFAGADPYRQAYEKGVKLIGATSHYVTAELDQGPIIEQEVVRVSHRLSVAELKNLGNDVERKVLARAVRWHAENRVIVDGNKTVVFTK
ncbi:MAG TPA: formyltetrahydrofolate deformylase [Gammaproteobacteria bacterium]|nr:formyltetrahydrofolate deformylase [Gammaproteobacteria bacterium]